MRTLRTDSVAVKKWYIDMPVDCSEVHNSSQTLVSLWKKNSIPIIIYFALNPMYSPLSSGHVRLISSNTQSEILRLISIPIIPYLS